MSNETRIAMLTARKNLLNQRDPSGNANIIRKIDRQIRKLSIHLTETGIGCCYELECPVCHEQVDITDTESW